MSEPTIETPSLLIGNSPEMRRVRALIRRVAPARLPVLIQGPTGSGKELVAHELHSMSKRRGPFVAMNVCALADGMFEDALFGHVRGAFTSAQSDAAGYLLEADRGTLFLDEIGGLSLAAQAKLLRVIETKRFRPIGARSDQSSDFRIISAANEPLQVLVPQAKFREDLLFRLNGVVIEVPALADHREDIPELARDFASRASVGAERSFVFADEALAMLMEHSWPGNVRELRAVIERVAVLSDDGMVGARALSQAMSLGVWQAGARRRHRSDFATQRLLSVLRETDGNVGETAALLGVHRTTVYRRLVRAGVHRLGLRSEEVVARELSPSQVLPAARRRD